MKKIFVILFTLLFVGFAASAQTTTPEKTKVVTTTKVKPVKTVKDRVHNTIHPKHKRYSGMKVKKEIKKED